MERVSAFADGNFGLMVTMIVLTLLIDIIALNPGVSLQVHDSAMILLFILTLYPMYYVQNCLHKLRYRPFIH